jgi:hypothetical protein
VCHILGDDAVNESGGRAVIAGIDSPSLCEVCACRIVVQDLGIDQEELASIQDAGAAAE